MKIKFEPSIVAVVMVCVALPSFSQTNNDTSGVSDRDHRAPGAVTDPNSASNSVVMQSGQTGTNMNNGVDDRDNRQTTSTALNSSAQPNRWHDDSLDAQYRFGRLEKAEKIIGAEVKDAQGQKLGKVKDLAIDFKNGRVVEVVVAHGGHLGMDEKFVAVPPSQFTWNDQTLQISDAAKLDSAPAVKLSDWETSMNQDKVSAVYQYYGTTPYFQSGEARSTNNRNAADDNSRNQLGEVQRASKVIGLNVRNLQSEKVGRVQDLIVDLQAGRLVEVIVASGGFMRLGGELSAIPPQSFSYGIHSDVLTLDRSRSDLASAPHFKSGDLNQATNRDQVQTVYQSYHVPAYFDTNRVDNTAQNSQDRDGNSLTPLQQGNSPADVDTTRQIRRQIVADTSLSVNAHNVKIITIDGKVTLRGPVNSEEEKREIGEIAAKVATASNVTNQLQVRNASTTSSIN